MITELGRGTGSVNISTDSEMLHRQSHSKYKSPMTGTQDT